MIVNDATRLKLAIFVLAPLAAGRALAADPAATEPNAAQVDAIVRKLESSGALDAAVERAIDRYIMRREQARQAEEARKQADLGKRARPIDLAKDHIRGSPTAEISLIEYADFECPFCKRFHATPKMLLDRYGGRVNWVLRNFPLPFHNPAARNEALAAECVGRLADNASYWKYADAVYANTKSGGTGLPPEQSVDKLAATIGVEGPALTRCMSDPAMGAHIDQDIADGTAAGVTGTPTTVVRDNRTGASEALVGALPIETLTATIDRLLAAKP